MARSVDEKYSLEQFVSFFEESETASFGARNSAERARDYKDGKQWTPAEVATLKARKQPVVTINRIKPKVDAMLGMERQSRTDPKALPRNPQHADEADSATQAIRYVCDDNDFDALRSQVFDNLVVEGVGGAEVMVEDKGREVEIKIRRYAFDRIFYDPHSRELDFSDAKYLGGVVWMDKADAIAQWPEAREIIEQGFLETSAQSDTYDDVPRVRWTDPKRKRIRACLVYCRKPDGWHYAWYTKAGFLQGPDVSPYEDEDGTPDCPLIFQSAYVDREGNRYGYVHQLMDIQDEINQRRSKALHLINQRQTYGNDTSIDDPRELKRELAKPDGHVQMRHGEFGRDFGIIPTVDLSQGNMALLAEAKGEIDAVGANAAMQGKDDRDMSGRALLSRQQSGQLEIAPLMDGLRQWQNRVYRATWNRVRQFWTGERWLRVTDDEQNLKWVQLNQPLTVAEAIEQRGEQVPEQLADDPRLQQPAMDTQGNPILRNNVAELDVDIIIEDVPDVANLQQEVFQMFADAVRASGTQVPIEVWIDLMPGFPKKRELIDKLSPPGEMQEQMQAMQQQMQEMQIALQQAELMKTRAEVEETTADTRKTLADAEKTRIEAIIAATSAPVDIEHKQAQTVNEYQNAQMRPIEFEAQQLREQSRDQQTPPRRGFS